MGSSNESIRRMHLTLAGVDGEAIGTCQYYDLIPYVSDFPSGATYHVDYYPIMDSLMTNFVKLTLQYRIYNTAEADTEVKKENDLLSRDGQDPAAEVNTSATSSLHREQQGVDTTRHPTAVEDSRDTGFVLASEGLALEGRLFVMPDPESGSFFHFGADELNGIPLNFASCRDICTESLFLRPSSDLDIVAGVARSIQVRVDIAGESYFDAYYRCRRVLQSPNFFEDWRSTWCDDERTLLHEFLMSLVSKTHLWLYKCDQIDTRALPDSLQTASIYTILDQEKLKDIQLPSTREEWSPFDQNPPPRAEVVIYLHRRAAAEHEDTWADNRSFSIKGYPETYSIEGLPDRWVAVIARQEEPRRKICLVSYDYGAEVASKTPTNEPKLLREWCDQFDHFDLDSDYYDSDSEEGSQENDENFALVEWAPDCVDGIENDCCGLVKFKHRGSGSTFEGVPRGQLVREGKYTGFVVITEVGEKRRTLAVRDHDLLQEYAHNCARPHPSPPKIVPLVGNQMDATFELAYSRGGEIEAFAMKYED
ncbi:hypothetical protein KC331_g3154 [Hortaea werneckii]|nr:hypothetical protein KC331_g3154 [Hortaea werneckii]KAI7718899.1 hypothetical protein KC353_g3406 [Hortaea werneckii]